MKIVCSWCDSVMVEGEAPITHSICKSCEADVERELKRDDALPSLFPRRCLSSYILSVLLHPLRGFVRWD